LVPSGLPSNPYDAVLFDFDGVLVDSEPLHFACWRDVAARLNLHLDWDWYEHHAIGIADRDMVPLVCSLNTRPDLVPALWNLFDEKKRLFGERIATELPMLASVRDLLLSLPVPFAVVSTSFRREIEPALVAADVRDRLAALICGEDVQNLKPHPEPYLTAAARLGATSPLVVEDSDTGAAAGQAAGFSVVRVSASSETPAKVRQALNIY
jgi:beta-phosphoglucomutase